VGHAITAAWDYTIRGPARLRFHRASRHAQATCLREIDVTQWVTPKHRMCFSFRFAKMKAPGREYSASSLAIPAET
jgi:hypothetical protein